MTIETFPREKIVKHLPSRDPDLDYRCHFCDLKFADSKETCFVKTVKLNIYGEQKTEIDGREL